MGMYDNGTSGEARCAPFVAQGLLVVFDELNQQSDVRACQNNDLNDRV